MVRKVLPRLCDWDGRAQVNGSLPLARWLSSPIQKQCMPSYTTVFDIVARKLEGLGIKKVQLVSDWAKACETTAEKTLGDQLTYAQDILHMRKALHRSQTSGKQAAAQANEKCAAKPSDAAKRYHHLQGTSLQNLPLVTIYTQT